MTRYKLEGADHHHHHGHHHDRHERRIRHWSRAARIAAIVALLAYAFFWVLGREWPKLYETRTKDSDIIHVK